MLLSALVAHDWRERERVAGADFHVLALASAAGALLMVQANDLIVIFLGLEILSIGLYVLVGFDRQRVASSEAALKYFLARRVRVGDLHLRRRARSTARPARRTCRRSPTSSATTCVLRPGLLYAGGALLLIGFAFKVAAVPFHLWSPDVYEGAPTPVTGLMASIVKVGAFAALLRVLISALGTQLDTWRPILWALIVLTCLVGALARARPAQREAPARVLLDQPGRLHAARRLGRRAQAASRPRCSTSSPTRRSSSRPSRSSRSSAVAGDEHHAIDHYRGLARRQPWLGGALPVLLLSQLGVPLTVGFYAKYTVLAAALDSGGGALALIAILSAAIAAFFYLRWTLWLFADDEVERPLASPCRRASAVVIGVGVVVAVLFGLWPGPLVTWCQHATLLFLP